MHRRRAVAEQQLDAVAVLHAEEVELIDICRQLHERRHAGVPREFGVLHDPAAVPVTQQEVGETDELVGREHRLIDDGDAGVGKRRVGRGDGGRDARGIRRSRLGQLDDTTRILGAVGLELAQFVLRAEPPGAGEREVFGLFDGRHAAELRVDLAQPRELAFGRGLEIARAPDDPAFVFDVSHVALPQSTLAAGADTGPGREPGRPDRLVP